MTGAPGSYHSEMKSMAVFENGLAAVLAAAAEEVEHMECFDQEQRAEMYTILDALKADTDAHRDTVGRWVSDIKGEAADV